MTERASGLIGMVWDLAASIGVYYGLRIAGVSERPALLAATLVAASRLVWVAVRRRQVTWFAAVMLAVFGLSLLLTFVAGDARFLLLKESFVTAGVGVVFLLSVLGGRPLTLSAAQTSQPWRADAIARLFHDHPDIRRRFFVSSVVWGVGLLIESAVRVPLVYTLSTDAMVGLSEGLFWGTIGTLMAWSLFYTRAIWQDTKTSAKDDSEAASRS